MTYLIISFEIDGIHSWPNAPLKYKEFQQPHRHLFKVIGWYATGDSNDSARREKELFELRQETFDMLYSQGFPVKKNCIDFGPRSCEGLASFIKDKMGFAKVFVGESDFMGALVE